MSVAVVIVSRSLFLAQVCIEMLWRLCEVELGASAERSISRQWSAFLDRHPLPVLRFRAASPKRQSSNVGRELAGENLQTLPIAERRTKSSIKMPFVMRLGTKLIPCAECSPIGRGFQHDSVRTRLRNHSAIMKTPTKV